MDFINQVSKINLIFNIHRNLSLFHDLKAQQAYFYRHLQLKVKEQAYFFLVKQAIINELDLFYYVFHHSQDFKG